MHFYELTSLQGREGFRPLPVIADQPVSMIIVFCGAGLVDCDLGYLCKLQNDSEDKGILYFLIAVGCCSPLKPRRQSQR